MCANDPAFALGGTPPGGIWTGPGVSGGIGNFVFTPSPALIGGPHLLVYTFRGDLDCPPVTDTPARDGAARSAAGYRAPADTAFCLVGAGVPAAGRPAGGRRLEGAGRDGLGGHGLYVSRPRRC